MNDFAQRREHDAAEGKEAGGARDEGETTVETTSVCVGGAE